MPTVTEALRAARVILGQDAMHEAELVVAAAIRAESGGTPTRAALHAPEAELSARALDQVRTLARKRAAGKLLQHVTGTQAFLSHEYEVGPDVLVPRPETEVLALTAIERLRCRSEAPRSGLEIGIGSGVLSIELLSEFPTLHMLATELSPAAASRARANARRILGFPGADRLEVVMSPLAASVLEPLGPSPAADFLVANPPYLIRGSDEVQADVAAQEPGEALFAPDGDPLYFYRAIASGAAELLLPGGWVFLEVPHERAGETASLFVDDARWSDVRLMTDLAGRDRVLECRRAEVVARTMERS